MANKTLIVLRHTLKDGKLVSPEGAELARKRGLELSRELYNTVVVFHTALIRTLQTAVHLLTDTTENPEFSTFVASNIGSDELIDGMINPAFKEAVNDGMSNYAALREAHPEERFRSWVDGVMDDVRAMFERFDPGQKGLVIGHSPTVEMICAGVLDTLDLDEDYSSFSELEGVVIEQDENGEIDIVAIVPSDGDSILV